MMMQSRAVDRQSSPVLHGRLLAYAIQFSLIEECPLHLLWFLCRWEEWVGGDDWRTMIGKSKEIVDIFSHIDPKEIREFERFVQTLPEPYNPPHLYHAAEQLRNPQQVMGKLTEDREAAIQMNDQLEVVTLYLLYRNFCHPLPAPMLLFYISNMEFMIGQGWPGAAMVDYVFTKVAFTNRAPAILGLWSLDLMRQLLQAGAGPDVYGKEIEWIQAEENKLIARLERGDFMSED